MTKMITQPALFGQKHSSRDYTKAECWGKNQFNSSFPASLMAYMYSKGLNPIYIKTNKDNEIVQGEINGAELLGIDCFHRTIIWIYKMLLDFVTYDTFDYKRIIRLLSYNLANDKAFALPGTKSYLFLKSAEIVKPRVSKYEIKNIVLNTSLLLEASNDLSDLIKNLFQNDVA